MLALLCPVRQDLTDGGLISDCSTTDRFTQSIGSIWWSFVVNMPPAIIILVTYVFCIGDIDKVLAAPTGYPMVSVFQYSTGTPGGATGLTILMLILLIIIETSLIATTTRQTFAFARDNGMVFSKWLAKVNERFRVPANSVIFTIGFTVVISLINIGSTTAFNAFLSVSVSALMATYTLSIACILVKRLSGQPLPPARWKLFGKSAGPGATSGGLGRYGPFVNVVALIYSLWAFFWSFWPLFNHPTAETVSCGHVLTCRSKLMHVDELGHSHFRRRNANCRYRVRSPCAEDVRRTCGKS